MGLSDCHVFFIDICFNGQDCVPPVVDFSCLNGIFLPYGKWVHIGIDVGGNYSAGDDKPELHLTPLQLMSVDV